MSILVLGGAGYIGSHTVDQLVENGYDTVVVDNLCLGHREAVNKKARFYEGDIRDKDFMRQVFTKENIEGVIHFAAFSQVGESVEKPLKYFDDNIAGTIDLLEVMKEFDVDKIVFSSSAATYGEPETMPIREDFATTPKNPYGETKLIMEKMMKWCDNAYGLKYVALRYFNVAGAKPDGSIGEDHRPETHLVPIILQVALGEREELAIYGDDYDTEDGTCIRDYVQVCDLAHAHILALDYLLKGGDSDVFNIGSEKGFTVKEMLEAARRVTGKEIPARIAPRRAGDPAKLVASPEKIERVLGWKSKYENIEDIIATAWTWHQSHPNGFASDQD